MTPDRAAEMIAEEAWAAIVERGRFVMAVDGGTPARQMLRELAAKCVPWRAVYLVQASESADLLDDIPIPRENLLAEEAARREFAIFDVVYLVRGHEGFIVHSRHALCPEPDVNRQLDRVRSTHL
jgi:hypothetical protein